MATGIFLSKHRKNARVYLVGTKALEEELLAYGVRLVQDDPEIVLVGFDRELNYQKLENACFFLDQGAEFLATNADYLYPLPNGRFLPDCASICWMLTKATGKEPFFIGKPNRYMIDLLREKNGLSPGKSQSSATASTQTLPAGRMLELLPRSFCPGRPRKKICPYPPTDPILFSPP